MTNSLEVGTRRLGSLNDFSAAAPPIQVALDRAEQHIHVTLHWPDPTSPYAAWFTTPFERTGEGSNEPAQRGRPPKVLRFHDSHGGVLLRGCRTGGFRSNMWGPGEGTISAEHAVLGVTDNLDAEALTGMTSEMSGLRFWVGVSSVRHEYPAPGVEGHSSSVVGQDRAPIEIGAIGELAIKLQPDWLISPNGDQTTVSNLMQVVTTTTQPQAWRTHLNAHNAIRDLLMVSQWRTVATVVQTVQISGDLMNDGTQEHALWRQVVQAVDGEAITRDWVVKPSLVRYEDLGPEGLRRWFDVREKYARALDPVLSSNLLTRARALTHLATVGPGVEALGYLLLREDGIGREAAKKSSFEERLQRIADDLSGLTPFDLDEWVAKSPGVYNALKHANRTLPEELELIESWRKSSLAVRMWFAWKLGVPKDELAKRAKDDPQASAYYRLPE